MAAGKRNSLVGLIVVCALGWALVSGPSRTGSSESFEMSTPVVSQGIGNPVDSGAGASLMAKSGSRSAALGSIPVVVEPGVEAADAGEDFTAYLEQRSDWIERFPYVPTYGDGLVYDPVRYDPNDLSVPVEDIDPEAQKMVENHGFLRGFHENPLRFTEEFEQIYEVFDLAGWGENPLVVAWTYDTLKRYYEALRHDRYDVAEANRRYVHYTPSGPSVEYRDQTWGELADERYDTIVGTMVADRNYLEGERRITEEEAYDLADKLIASIPLEGAFEYPGVFAFIDQYEKELQAGDPLLYR